MTILITSDGVKTVPSLNSFIGKDADESISKIINDQNYNKVTDCIGIKGHRNITLVHGEKRIETVCDTVQANEVLKRSIAPSEAVWHIIDIFEYVDRQNQEKGGTLELINNNIAKNVFM